MFKKITKNSYIIKLHNKTADVPVKVYIKTGEYFFLTKKTQLPHLFEHCVATILHRNDFKFEATINEEYITFYSVFRKKEIDKIEKFLDIIFNHEISDEIIQKEKTIIETEISFPRIIDRIIKHCTNCDNDLMGIDNYEIKDFRKNYISEARYHIFIGMSDIKDESTNNIVSIVKKIKTSNQSKKIVMPVMIKNIGMDLEHYYKINANYNNSTNDIVMLWKSFDYKDKVEKIIIQNIIKDIFVSGRESILFKKLRLEKGLIYDVDGNAVVLDEFGYFYFHTACDKNSVKLVIECINKAIAEFLKSGIDKTKLSKIVKFAKRNNKKEWNGKLRYNWILTDILFFHKVYSADEVNELMDDITIDEIIDTAKEIFDQKQNIFLLGEFKT